MSSTTVNALRIRQLQIEMAADGFLKAHREWAENDPSETPTAAYWDATDNLIDTVDMGDIPEESRELVAAVNRLHAERENHDMGGSLVPHDGFWLAVKELGDIRKAQQADEQDEYYVEPMKVLAAQEVPHEQIARMYGLVYDSGKGKSHLVQKELDNPGSVIGPDWVHPVQQERNRKREEARQALESLRQREGNAEAPKNMAKPGESPRNCPETAKELFEQEITEEQASKMLGWPLAKVQAQWKAWQVDPESPEIGSEEGKAKGTGQQKKEREKARERGATKPKASPDAPPEKTVDPTPADLDGEGEGESEDDAQETGDDYENQNRKPLIELARSRGIQTNKDERKDVVIAKLRAFDAQNAPASA